MITSWGSALRGVCIRLKLNDTLERQEIWLFARNAPKVPGDEFEIPWRARTVRAIVRKTLTVVCDYKGAEVRYELIYADEVAGTGRTPC